jgi:3-methyladenine DNA glycosylase/8-oxoguanine DNA glycosylase
MNRHFETPQGRTGLGTRHPGVGHQVDALGERFRPWRTLAATYLYRTLRA